MTAYCDFFGSAVCIISLICIFKHRNVEVSMHYSTYCINLSYRL